VTLLGRFDGGNDFHKRTQSIDRAGYCQPKCPGRRGESFRCVLSRTYVGSFLTTRIVKLEPCSPLRGQT
jgi:hypothetical protein